MDGKVIFITTNATTDEPLGPEHQSPWWRKIGVLLVPELFCSARNCGWS
jgi:hypothetical protein